MQAESRADSALMDTNPGIAARPELHAQWRAQFRGLRSWQSHRDGKKPKGPASQNSEIREVWTKEVTKDQVQLLSNIPEA